MGQDVELFPHEVVPWTVGRLRQALEGLPADLPLQVWVAEEPGGEGVQRQVVVSADLAHLVMGDIEERIDQFLGVSCEFPSGVSCRRTR